MAKPEAEEITTEVVLVKEPGEAHDQHHHPYAFHVSGPRNVASPNWRDLINSSWSVKYSSPPFVSLYHFSLQVPVLGHGFTNS